MSRVDGPLEQPEAPCQQMWAASLAGAVLAHEEGEVKGGEPLSRMVGDVEHR